MADRLYERVEQTEADTQEATETISGIAKKPKHLEYYQTSSSSSYTTGAPARTVVFNSEVVKTGFDSEYNSSTGVFTASESGLYLFTTSCRAASTTPGSLLRVLTYLQVNSGGETDIIDDIVFTTDQDVGAYMGGGSKVLSLSNSDTVEVVVYADTATGTWFIQGTSPANRVYLTITKIA